MSALTEELNKLGIKHGVNLSWCEGLPQEHSNLRQNAVSVISGTAIKIRVTSMPVNCEVKTTKIEICIDNRTEATLDSERWKNKFDNVADTVEPCYIWMRDMLVAMVDSIDKVVRLQPSDTCKCGNVATAGSSLCSYCLEEP